MSASTVVILILAVLLVGLLIWTIVRWKRQLDGARALRAKLQADSNALSALRAQMASASQGNVTQVVVGSGVIHGHSGIGPSDDFVSSGFLRGIDSGNVDGPMIGELVEGVEVEALPMPEAVTHAD